MRRIVTAITGAALAFSMVASAIPANAAVAGYDSQYTFQSDWLTRSPGEQGTWSVTFKNTGTTTWTPGTSTDVQLAVCLDDKVTCNVSDPKEAPFNNAWVSATRYARMNLPAGKTSVATNDSASFTVNITVPAGQAPGTYFFNAALVKADTGEDIRNEGAYFEVKVPGVAAQTSAIAVSPDANTPDTNPVSDGTSTNRGAHTYTATIATSVTATTVDIQLIRSGDYTPSTGAFRDAEGDPVVGNNQADLRPVGSAVIEVVNGVAITPATRVNAVTIPANRTITFTVDSTGVADSIRPVVFVDANGNDNIDLNADNTASETAGVGGIKSWTAAGSASLANALDGCVTSLDKTAKNFTLDTTGQTETSPTQCANPSASSGDVLYNYDANDTFMVASVPSTMADFEAALSRGDAIIVLGYSSSPEPSSSFNITGDGPVLASCTAEKGSGAGSNDIKITIDPATPDYNTDTIGAFYTGFRIQRAPVTGTGADDEVTTGTVGTFTTVATSTTDGDANTTTVWEYTDMDVSAGTYRYRCAGIVDGDTGLDVADPNNETSVTPGSSDTAAPTSTDLFISTSAGLTGQLDTGDVFKVVFSETMTTDSSGDVILVQDADGTTMTINCTGATSSAAGNYGAVCNFNLGNETVKSTLYTTPRVLTVTITSTALPTASGAQGTTSGMQLPTTVTDQGGITDSTGNQWNVTGSSDRVVDIE